MNLAPIALFVYNRVEHTQKAIEALQKNMLAGESELFIFSDNARSQKDIGKVNDVRSYLSTITGFKKITITERPYNFGLANSIIDGVTAIVNQFNKIIVLEDDLILSPYFLTFMNEALWKYENTEQVISIHGFNVPINYPHPTFFLRGADCWGWATWRRGWALFNPDSRYLMEQLKKQKLLYDFDFEGCYNYSGMLQYQIDGVINSWAIRWYASAYLHNKLTLYPTQSLVENIGGDGSGTHGQNAEQYQTVLNQHQVTIPHIPIEESRIARKLIGKYHYKYQKWKIKLRKLLKWGY